VLENKRDLGIHTEMFSDGVMRLVEMGVITGRRKSLRPGKIVTTFCMGSRALYDFVDNNPGCEFLPTEYVNDPFTIARNDHMVAINAAIEVDLTGQVCSDSIGSRFYSGIGGQVDFIRGAARSRGGKPVIALPSTATLRDGRVVSKIVPVLQEGAGVVTSRGDVHYVVTEWGVAYLHGKSVRERALALVSIAHPDFRENLLAAAKGRCLITPDVSVQALTPRYPEEMEEDAVLNDGTEVLIRPIRPMDEDLLREFHYRLSDTTVYRRYRRPLKSLPRSERLKLVDIDYQSQMALIAVRRHDTRDEMLGVARYFVDPATRTAEVAFVVRDDWHGKGIGGLLLGRLIGAASGQGLHALEAYCQLDNLPMIDLLLRRGFVIVEDNDPDTRRLRLNLEAMPSK
jgi:RimJ/RimL family protein N-acetyltransferase